MKAGAELEITPRRSSMAAKKSKKVISAGNKQGGLSGKKATNSKGKGSKTFKKAFAV